MSLLDELVESQERYQREVWTQTREARYSVERALLERNIADVERTLAEWLLLATNAAGRAAHLAAEARFCAGIDPLLARDEEAYLAGAAYEQRRAAWHYAEARMYRDWIADCKAWLARVRAVLG